MTLLKILGEVNLKNRFRESSANNVAKHTITIHPLICVLLLFVSPVNVVLDFVGCLDQKLKRQKSFRVCGNGRPESGIAYVHPNSHCVCKRVNMYTFM